MARIQAFIRKIEIASFSRELTKSETQAFNLACQVTDHSAAYEVAAVCAFIDGLGAR